MVFPEDSDAFFHTRSMDEFITTLRKKNSRTTQPFRF